MLECLAGRSILLMHQPLAMQERVKLSVLSIRMAKLLVLERNRVLYLRGGGGELGTNKNFDLWLQLVCTKLKLKHAI